MTRDEAFDLAKSLKRGGMSSRLISEELKNKKFSMTASGIDYMLRRGNLSKQKTRTLPVAYERIPPEQIPTTPPSGYVMVVIGKPEHMRDIIAGAMK